MKQMDWEDLRYVLAVADKGSLSGAARKLGVNHATVLRRVNAFEENMGIAVFDRTARGYRIAPRRRRVLDAMQAVEEAAQAVTGQQVTLHSAGRTDTGVHALAMRSHFDVESKLTPFRMGEAINAHLRPAPIAVTHCEVVPEEWHARFSCVGRRYLYRIVNRRAPLTLESGLVWKVPGPLDADAMQEAARHLLGQHDFTTFRSTMCQAASPVKTLDSVDIAEVETEAGTEVHARFRARSFLHNQVRSLIGTLERVGSGAWAPGDVARALAARDRAACGPVAPPQGLCLTGVGYPDDPFA